MSDSAEQFLSEAERLERAEAEEAIRVALYGLRVFKESIVREQGHRVLTKVLERLEEAQVPNLSVQMHERDGLILTIQRHHTSVYVDPGYEQEPPTLKTFEGSVCAEWDAKTATFVRPSSSERNSVVASVIDVALGVLFSNRSRQV